MRRRDETSEPPAGLDLDEAFDWLVAHGATLDEFDAYFWAHSDWESVPDPRLGVT